MKWISALKKSVSLGLWVVALAGGLSAKEITLLNVSYDPTRELYTEYNKAFAKYWKAKTGDDVTINQSHGGSGKQARSVLDGLDADVVTLALAGDVNSLYEKGKLIPSDWQKQLPDNSTPYISTIVFLVRKDNPKGIKDWSDLGKAGVKVITPNPKTSGGARWNFLAAFKDALDKNGGDEDKAAAAVKKIFDNVAVYDTGARGSTTTFAERGIGDVLITWENEAFLVLQSAGKGKVDIVVPPSSILAEPPVAVVDRVASRRGTSEVAKAYLEYLYSEEGQTIAAKHHYRPRDPKVAAKYADKFPKLKLATIDGDFGGWAKAQPKFFGDGGIFDKIFAR
jgi:sulfate transport system substrate-binding protein